ncbi:diguanylate cyclase domain-containing protein [Streptomyces sp. NRRL WC-3549]|uniref:diguanylate cyclase domain-containing protein n=1 Tax=Streptomyces sp. NRRL WC-3549 TaxID=1463925 RepID=UPI0009EBFBAC|nr:diguanylate cyclase [Streptomyces sp. NRRL WC-3549]
MGHPAGDAVLAAFGTRLTAWAGPRASVGRLGGDVFAVVLELKSGRRAQRLEQLVRMLHTPVALDDGRTVDVAASVDAAAPASVGSRDLTVLQRAADAVLYPVSVVAERFLPVGASDAAAAARAIDIELPVPNEYGRPVGSTRLRPPDREANDREIGDRQ